MNGLQNFSSVNITPRGIHAEQVPGKLVRDTVREAIAIAQEHRTCVGFTANHVKLVVGWADSVDEVMEAFYENSSQNF